MTDRGYARAKLFCDYTTGGLLCVRRGYELPSNVTSAGWQVTLRDPMWHVSYRSGVAT